MATIAVVFGGGAANGAYQAGVWAVLGPRLRPTFVIGSSIGAINAAGTARMLPEQVPQWWQHFSEAKVNGPIFLRRHFVPVLDRMLQAPKLDSRAVLAVTTSVPDFQAHVTRLDVLTAPEAREWLLASRAMPGVFFAS